MACIITGLVKIAIKSCEFQINSNLNNFILVILQVIYEMEGKRCQYLLKILNFMCKEINCKLQMLNNGILDLIFVLLYGKTVVFEPT